MSRRARREDDPHRDLRAAQEAAARRPHDAATQRQLAEAWMAVSQSLLGEGRFAEADAAAGHAIAAADRHAEQAGPPPPDDPPGERNAARQVALLRASALVQRGTTLLEVFAAATDDARRDPDRIPDHLPPDPGDAVRVLTQAADLLTPLVERDHGDFETAALLSSTHGSLAVALESDGRVDDAFPHLRAALAFAERVARARPDDLRAISTLALANNTLGHHYATTDRLQDAWAHHQESLRLNGELVRLDGDDPYWQYCLATDHENLCDLADRLGRSELALEHARQCAAMRARVTAGRDVPREWRVQHADALRDVAEMALDAGLVDEGLASYGTMREVLGELVAEFGDEDSLFRFADGLLVYGYALEEQHRWDDALDAFLRALQTDERLIASRPEETRWHANAAHCHLCAALVLLEKDDPQRADLHAQAGLAILQKQLETHPDDPGLLRDLSHFHTELAAVYGRLEDLPESIRHYAAAERVDSRLVQQDDADHESVASLAFVYDSLAGAHERLGDFSEAARYGELAIRTEERLVALDPESVPYQTRLVQALLNLANTHLGDGAPDASMRALKRASTLAARLARLVPKDEEVAALGAQIERAIGETYRDLGDRAEAEACLIRSTTRLAALVARSSEPLAWYSAQAESLEALGELRLDLDRPADAIDSLRLALERRLALASAEPLDAAAGRELGRTHETLAEALEAVGDFGGANQHRAQAARLFERYGDDG
ncbi:MAG: hypothetical protein IPM29_13180 [Planctomycetes bacterium]|nr:hypothetical protein [Planctomycetota bacterium]